MRVALDGHIWTFNPLSVTLVSSTSETGNAASAEENRDRGQLNSPFISLSS